MMPNTISLHLVYGKTFFHMFIQLHTVQQTKGPVIIYGGGGGVAKNVFVGKNTTDPIIKKSKNFVQPNFK